LAPGLKISPFPAVLRLLCWGFPSAILRLVWAVIVYSAERFSRWALAHVGEELCEGVFPSIANGDPAATIRREFVVPRVQASLLHGSPRLVLSGLSHAVLKVSRIADVLASLAFCSQAAGELGLHCYKALSAVADAIPCTLRSFVRNAYCQQTSKLHPGNVFLWRAHAA
jgi:hypothetical protein